MGITSKLFGEKRDLKISLIFLALCAIFAILALIVGIADNLPGFLLLVLGTFAMALAFVHRWRKSRKFEILTIASFIGFFVFAILHGVFEALGEKFIDTVIIYYLFAGINVSSFFMAILICPVGFIVGFIGFAKLSTKEYERRRSQPKQDN
ncbi:MAG: hypothetical protein JSW64_07785 [Candidatus Zixiibacteriota bacterium]|nr:MAG: hypothetical protein JSW64_07785 [candidate division Zixibacteria bacterium]